MNSINWHPLIEGDPSETGRYIVAHRGTARLATYSVPENMPKGSACKGWDIDVSFATHWAKEPHAPDDGTPQLFKARQIRADHDEAASWNELGRLMP